VAHAPEPLYCDSRRSNTAQGEGRACIAKKEEFKGKKTIDDAQSEDGKRPQGYQKERDQKPVRKAGRASKPRGTAKKPGRKSSKSR
jgi:hypothetical protein